MKLELKYLAGYLPYGLKGTLTSDSQDDFEDLIEDLSINENKFIKGAIWQYAGYADEDLCVPLGNGEINGFLMRNENTYASFYGVIKPILRPLSDLTKEIEANGEKFVPIVYFEKFNTQIDFVKEIKVLQNDIRWLSTTSYLVVEKLLEWHFDIYGLIENNLAIDINTL